MKFTAKTAICISGICRFVDKVIKNASSKAAKYASLQKNQAMFSSMCAMFSFMCVT